MRSHKSCTLFLKIEYFVLQWVELAPSRNANSFFTGKDDFRAYGKKSKVIPFTHHFGSYKKGFLSIL